MLGVEIVDAEGHVAVAVAQRVGLRAALVDGQLDLEIGFGIAQIDKREGVEIQPVGNFQAECRSIEVYRARFLKHADHRMDRFCQSLLPVSRANYAPWTPEVVAASYHAPR